MKIQAHPLPAAQMLHLIVLLIPAFQDDAICPLADNSEHFVPRTNATTIDELLD